MKQLTDHDTPHHCLLHRVWNEEQPACSCSFQRRGILAIINLLSCNNRTVLGMLLSLCDKAAPNRRQGDCGQAAYFAALMPMITSSTSIHQDGTHGSTPRLHTTAPHHTPHHRSLSKPMHTQELLWIISIGVFFIHHILLFGKGSPLFWGVIKRSYCSLSFCWHESNYSY